MYKYLELAALKPDFCNPLLYIRLSSPLGIEEKLPAYIHITPLRYSDQCLMLQGGVFILFRNLV